MTAAGAVYRTAARTLEREAEDIARRYRSVLRLSDDLLAEATALNARADGLRKQATALRDLADGEEDAEAMRLHWGEQVTAIVEGVGG